MRRGTGGGSIAEHTASAGGGGGLTANDIPRLKLKWSFGFAGASASGSQVSIVGNRVFVGSRNGVMYALDRQTGCLVWAFEADAGTRSTPVVVRAAGPNAATVYFGDAHAQVYALDAATGALKWKVKVEEHPDAMITGGVVFHDNRLYVPVSSLEEGTAVLTSYECCTFRGSVVSLDAATGTQVWKTYTIPRTPEPAGKNSVGTQLRAPSGAAVWSAPALEPERNRLYITTGDSYSAPAAPESDSIMALAMDTGRVLWIRQTLQSDSWNTACLGTTPAEKINCPTQSGPDHDFGSSPALATTPNGQRVLLAGQKSGALFGINPDTGDVQWKTQVGEGGVLGGIEWGFSVDSDVAYVSLSSAFEKKPGQAGGLVAINVADGSRALVSAARGRHVRGPARLQHRAAGRGVVDPWRGVLRQPRRSLPGVRQQQRQGAARREHDQRVRHGERRAGARRVDQRPWRIDRGRHGVRELGLQHDRLHARQRAPRVLGGGEIVSRLGLSALGVGKLGVELELLRFCDLGGADASVVQRRREKRAVAARLRDAHEVVPLAHSATGDQSQVGSRCADPFQ